MRFYCWFYHTLLSAILDEDVTELRQIPPPVFTGDIYRSGKYSSSGKYWQIDSFFALKYSRNLKQDGLKQYNQTK